MQLQFSKLLLSLFLALLAVHASPVEPRTTSSTTGLIKIGPLSPTLHDLSGSAVISVPGATTTTPNTGFETLVASDTESYLYLCTAAGCNDCYVFTLSAFKQFTCYSFVPSPPVPYISAGVIRTDTSGTLHSVHLGNTCDLTDSTAWAFLHDMNACYSVNPGGSTFFLAGECLGCVEWW